MVAAEDAGGVKAMSRVRGRTAGKRRWKKRVWRRALATSLTKEDSVKTSRWWVGGREGRLEVLLDMVGWGLIIVMREACP